MKELFQSRAKEEDEEKLLPDARDEVVLALAHGDVEGCLPPKMRGPETLANGELVDAYDANPP